MPHIIANGAKISYQQVGDGPDVVLIHGLATNRAFWFVHTLQALKNEYRVTIFDLRGHGYSSMPDNGYTSADMASDLAALMDHLRIEDAVLVGHSFGGVVGLQYATGHQERVKGFVLADSRIHSVPPTQSLVDQPELLGLEKELIAESGEDWRKEPHVGMRLLEELARRKLKEGRPTTAKGFNPFGGMGKGERLARLWLKLLETTTARDDIRSSAGLTLNRITAFNKPILLNYGERSRCMETCRQLQQRLPQSDAIIVPGTGHFHPITKPRYFTNAVLDFIEMTQFVPDGSDPKSTFKTSYSDRRESNAGAGYIEQHCRRKGERRVAWRKRGWDGPDRRKGARGPGYKWLGQDFNEEFQNSPALNENIEEKKT